MQQDSIDQIEEEALTWQMRLTSGEFSPEQVHKLEQWLARSATHQRAFEEAKMLWQGLGELQDRPVITEQMADKSAAVDQAIVQSQAVENDNKLSTVQLLHKSKKSWASYRLSYATAACLVLLTLLLNPDPESMDLWFAEHHTAIGEQQTLTLADGSLVYMNTASALNIEYTAQQRSIKLIAGEAEFIVSKDSSRPFIVIANGQQVKALGTDFIVKNQAQGVTVSVIESAVRVSQLESPDVASVDLYPGEQLIALTGQQPGVVITVKPTRMQAWRNNRLIFESEPLGNVVEEINRYRPGHVFLTDASLAKYPVSGVFNIDQIDQVLAVIDKTLPVKSVWLGKRFVLLY